MYFLPPSFKYACEIYSELAECTLILCSDVCEGANMSVWGREKKNLIYVCQLS